MKLPDDMPLEKVLLVQVQRLNARASGFVTGLVAGLGLFAATNWLVIKGGDDVGGHLQLLGHFFPGYTVTFVGSLIGFTYALVAGSVVGYLVARVYNAISRINGGGRASS